MDRNWSPVDYSGQRGVNAAATAEVQCKMFHGFEQAKIDEKGRLKIPSRFRQKLVDKFGPDVFMTMIKPDTLTIFPLSVWEEKEEKFLQVPDSLPEKDRFILTANYFGTEKTVDEQGRLPIPPNLRSRVGLEGEVAVVGYLKTLVVMDLTRAEQWAGENFPDPAVFDRLREYGI